MSQRSKHIAFVVNPKAGVKKKISIPSLIKENLFFSTYEIYNWTQVNSLSEILGDIKSKPFDTVVAVGGDGTVNAVATGLLHGRQALGIIPFGSGNGFARSLHIPMTPHEAVQHLEKCETKIADSALLHSQSFFCTAGFGFDAHVSHLFAGNKTRGFKSYAKIIIREYMFYQPTNYKIWADEKLVYEGPAFMGTVANAQQFGNNLYIAPKANLFDGVLNLTLIKPFKPLAGFPLVAKMMRQRIEASRHVLTFKAKKFRVEREKEGAVHYDGEPATMPKELLFTIQPASLPVIWKNP